MLAKEMEMESVIGRMDIITSESGKWMKKTGMGFGVRGSRESAIWEIGNSICRMDLEFSKKLTFRSTRDKSKIGGLTEEEKSILKIKISLRVYSGRECLKARGSTPGKTKASLQESFKKV